MNNKDKYKRFCETEKELPIFFNDYFLNAVCHSKNWNVLLYEINNKVVAAFPYFIKNNFGFNIIENPILTKYLGPYISSEFRKTKHVYKIYDFFIKNLPKVALFNLSFFYTQNNILPFVWQNFNANLKYSYTIEDLSDLEKVYQNFSSDYKNRKIPQAEKIVKVAHNKSLKQFYQVNKMSIDRQKIKFPFDFSFFEQFDNALKKHKKRELFFAVDEKNQIHAVTYLIWDNNYSYMLLAGNDINLRKSGAAVFLVWQAIKYTKNVLKLNKLDFLGSMIKPIELTRRQFGATQKQYLTVQKYNSKLYEFLHLIKK